MRYWAYINNEVLGPFEKEKLKELSNFGPASLICPEGGQADGWKEASAFSEVLAVLSPAPAKPQTPPRMTPQRMAEDSPLAMTMRGTIIELPPAASPAPAASPPGSVPGRPPKADAPAPATPPRQAEEPPLAMTMRGTLIETGPSASQAAASASAFARAVEHVSLEKPKDSPGPVSVDRAPAALERSPSPQGQASELEQLKRKLEQMNALLTSMGDSQFQLLSRLNRLENGITGIMALLSPPPPKKD